MKKEQSVASIQLFIQTIVKDKDGNVVHDSGERQAHSFVLQFLQILNSIWDAADIANVLDTGNVARTVVTAGGNITDYMFVDAAAADDTFGVVVGTGSGAESNTDVALTTQIVDGAGAGQLDHGANSFTIATEIAGNVDFVIVRIFTNNSGGGITVNEIGIYCRSEDTGGTDRYFCIVRDLQTDTVNDGQTYTVTYKLRTTV